MKALGERNPIHPRKVKKSYLTPKLLVVEKNIQNLNNFGRESYKRKFYLFTMWSVGRDLSSSILFLDAEINI